MTAVRRSVTAVVDAPPDVVWRLVSDVARIGEWSPETESAEWLSGEPGAVGATFRGRNRRGRASWSTTCQVVESVPGKVFTFVVGSPASPSARWRYQLEQSGPGTRVTESFELPRPLSALSRLTTRLFLGVRDREADLVDGMERTLRRLAATAESPGRSARPT